MKHYGFFLLVMATLATLVAGCATAEPTEVVTPNASPTCLSDISIDRVDESVTVEVGVGCEGNLTIVVTALGITGAIRDKPVTTGQNVKATWDLADVYEVNVRLETAEGAFLAENTSYFTPKGSG